MPAKPIGVFDSGVGGLTVAAEIFRQMPGEPIIYFGDTAHVPYGSRPVDELIAYARNITRFLVEQGVKMVIIACNTSSSLALEILQSSHPVPIIGVVEPGVATALQATRNSRIGVIATEATIKNGAHERLIRERNPEVKVFVQACPRFVPLVEGGKVNSPEAREAAREYLAPLQQAQIDTLILGCTHYPYLQGVLREILGPQTVLVDPAEETVRMAKKELKARGLLESQGGKGVKHVFYASGDPRPFARAASALLGWDVGNVCHVNLDEPLVVPLAGSDY